MISAILFAFLAFALILIYKDTKKSNKGEAKLIAPGPRRYPIIGSIPFMAKYTNPIHAFSALHKQFGDLVTLQLGYVDAMVVSGLDNIRKVLVTKAHQFDSRPGFKRFHMLFEDNKNNSLAFCDWNESHKKKREIVSHHSFPKTASTYFTNFNGVLSQELHQMTEELKTQVGTETKGVHLKPVLMEKTFQIFLRYFCSMKFEDEEIKNEALEIAQCFDDVFQEVNSQCVGDIFPALMPICGKGHLYEFGHKIRKFTMNRVVSPRLEQRKQEQNQVDENNNGESAETKEPIVQDLLDEFLVNIGKVENMTLENALFAMEDIFGGSSAVTNFLTTVIVYLAQNPEVQTKIRSEINEIVADDNETVISLLHKLSYSESVVLESARNLSSPLVPHVSNEDTHLGDYFVKKGTVLFLNNTDLHFSTELWDQPEKFMPERFLTEEGRVLKPDHFFPFGTGRRSCLGFKVLMNTATLTIANLCSAFNIELDTSETYNLGLGTLAVPGLGYKVKLTKLN